MAVSNTDDIDRRNYVYLCSQLKYYFFKKSSNIHIKLFSVIREVDILMKNFLTQVKVEAVRYSLGSWIMFLS